MADNAENGTRATTRTLLRGLTLLEMIGDAPDDRRYRLAGKALALSHDYTNRVDLRALAMPLLSELRDQWDETVHLGVIEGNDVVYVERLAPSATVQVVSIV